MLQELSPNSQILRSASPNCYVKSHFHTKMSGRTPLAIAKSTNSTKMSGRTPLAIAKSTNPTKMSGRTPLAIAKSTNPTKMSGRTPLVIAQSTNPKINKPHEDVRANAPCHCQIHKSQNQQTPRRCQGERLLPLPNRQIPKSTNCYIISP